MNRYRGQVKSEQEVRQLICDELILDGVGMDQDILEALCKFLSKTVRDSAAAETSRSQPKANPYLPAEILHQIWRYVLCPHGGFNLHIDGNWIPQLLKRGPVPIQPHFDSRPTSPTTDRSIEDEFGRSNSSDDSLSLNHGADDGYHRALRAQAGIEVAILRLNHSTYEECLPLLYSMNKFTFNTDTVTMTRWLAARSTRQMKLIRHVGLPKRLVTRGVSKQSICNLIAHRMQVETVTMWYPRDEDPEAVYEEGQYEWHTPNWYKCAKEFQALLQDRKIVQLRLLFARDGKRSRVRPAFNLFHLCYEPVFLPQDIDPNTIAVVNKLNRTPNTSAVEPIAYAEFETAHEGLPASAYEACSRRFEVYIKALRSGNMRTFTISREDCCGVDEGTVMVLRLVKSLNDDFICQDRPQWHGRHRKANNDLAIR